ncbi:MAG: hypothetical protein HY286_17475 [Planctomycetes bacterium]|nr:hypothetical protein [Planctomycetota bacterium]
MLTVCTKFGVIFTACLATVPAAAAIALAKPTLAGLTVNNVAPAQGAEGSPIVFTGSGFDNPTISLLLPLESGKFKKVKFKIAAINSVEVDAIEPAAPAGTYDLLIEQKDGVIMLQSAFTVKKAAGGNATPMHAAPGSAFTLDGTLFGIKKGKLFLGMSNKALKITDWTPTAVTAIVPKGTAPGDYTIEVKNTAGTSTATGMLTVVPGAPSPSGKDSTTAVVDDVASFSASANHIIVSYDFFNFLGDVTATNDSNAAQSIAMRLPYNLNTDKAPKQIKDDPLGYIKYTDTSQNTTWSSAANGGTYTFNVQTESGSTSKGSHVTLWGGGILTRESGVGGPATVELYVSVRCFF